MWASTRKLGCAFADAHSGGAGRLVPLLCPDWHAAGLMTGSGWFDSAHELQVYHFYPFTPLALRLGVVFVLGEFMKSKSYEEFVEKFKPKKTTDDCYTPPLVYETVKEWACEKYGISPDKIVRPFYPGGDYEHADYPDGCVVLDNPPFSILSKICEFYLDRNIPFFLFAPSLTALSGRSVVMRMNHVICAASIVYENGAVVRTSFVTSFGGDTVAQTEPELTRRINRAVEAIRKETARELPKYIRIQIMLLQRLCFKDTQSMEWSFLSSVTNARLFHGWTHRESRGRSYSAAVYF